MDGLKEYQRRRLDLVAYDGEHLGHVLREGPREPEERWVAVR